MDMGSQQGGWRGEGIVRTNHFAGCISGGCPNVGRCTTNRRFAACPEPERELFAQDVAAVQNTLLDRFFDKIGDSITGVSNAFDLNASYVSVGTSTAVTSPTQSQLFAEVYRDVFVDRQRPSMGVSVFYWFFGTTVANGALREWGFVAGNPTATLGTGDLINRFLYTIDKTSSDTVSGQYTVSGANA